MKQIVVKKDLGAQENNMKPIKKLFPKENLLALDLPYEAEEKEIVSRTRWSIVYKIIFRFPDQNDGTAWMTFFEEGATENQETSPWEGKKEVECSLVKKVLVTKFEWQQITEE